MDSILSGEKKPLEKHLKKVKGLERFIVCSYTVQKSDHMFSGKVRSWRTHEKGSSVQDICLLLSLEIFCKDDPT